MKPMTAPPMPGLPRKKASDIFKKTKPALTNPPGTMKRAYKGRPA